MRYFFFLLIVIPQFLKAQSCSGHWVNNHPLTFQCISGQQIGLPPMGNPVGCPINPVYTSLQTNTYIFDNAVNDFFIDFNAFSSTPGCARLQIKINGNFFPLTSDQLIELPFGTLCSGSVSFLTVTSDGYITTSSLALNNSNGQGRLIFLGVNTNSITISTNDNGGGSVVAAPCVEPLPLYLKFFNCSINENCEVNIAFESGVESNVRNIEVEGSSDGVAFSKLLELSPQGSDSKYSVQCKSSGNNFYRLKMNDLDGNFSYSEIIRINNNCTSSPIRISPNPSREKILIENLQRYDQLIIVDILGRDLYHDQVINNSTQINIHHLSSGLYFLKVFRQHVKVETAKFLKK